MVEHEVTSRGDVHDLALLGVSSPRCTARRSATCAVQRTLAATNRPPIRMLVKEHRRWRSDTALDIDWNQFELIECVPGKVSGRPVVRGTRIMPEAIVGSYDLEKRRGASPRVSTLSMAR